MKEICLFNSCFSFGSVLAITVTVLVGAEETFPMAGYQRGEGVILCMRLQFWLCSPDSSCCAYHH